MPSSLRLPNARANLPGCLELCSEVGQLRLVPQESGSWVIAHDAVQILRIFVGRQTEVEPTRSARLFARPASVKAAVENVDSEVPSVLVIHSCGCTPVALSLSPWSA